MATLGDLSVLTVIFLVKILFFSYQPTFAKNRTIFMIGAESVKFAM